jgi:hypothetical protein
MSAATNTGGIATKQLCLTNGSAFLCSKEKKTPDHTVVFCQDFLKFKSWPVVIIYVSTEDVAPQTDLKKKISLEYFLIFSVWNFK